MLATSVLCRCNGILETTDTRTFARANLLRIATGKIVQWILASPAQKVAKGTSFYTKRTVDYGDILF